tara:strand:+ start:592 stop:1011 length:420 start_codon:yes stop_codon:yes gene_type:complete
MSVQVEVTKALINVLRNDAALTALLSTYAGGSGVFYHVPQNFNSYPYVVVYDIDLSSDNNDATLAFDGVVNIHSWSDDRDISTVGNVMQAVYNALNRIDFVMNGYSLINIVQENEVVLRDQDGITLHGVQRLRIILETN